MVAGIGRYNDLQVVRSSPHGLYLAFGETEVLLPNKYVPENSKEGQVIRVFVYKDSEDRLVATTLQPAGVVGDFVVLEVVAVAPFGAFMEWGLEKHLLVPNAEMAQKMEVGRKYVVRIVLDYRTERLIGVSKIEAFLTEPEDLQPGEEVAGLIFKKTDLGYKVVVNQQYNGIIYHNTIFTPVSLGQAITCYVDKVRADGKIDLRLKKGGLESIDSDANKLLAYLQAQGGAITLTDKSSPAAIKTALGLSKKAFKKAVGTLYKQKIIALQTNGIKLLA